MFRIAGDAPDGEGRVVGSRHEPTGTVPPAIGRIQTTIGSVAVTRSSGVVDQVDAGALVYLGDVIETDVDGAVGIAFTDGTTFNLSAGSRMVLNEFVCDPSGTANSALFSLVKGTFAFIAGKVAKSGSLWIDTPAARIRGAQGGGIGTVTLAALTFAVMEKVQAASSRVGFLDDGEITFKDLEHGIITATRKSDGREFIIDDPGVTVVVGERDVQYVVNSAARMENLLSFSDAARVTHLLALDALVVL